MNAIALSVLLKSFEKKIFFERDNLESKSKIVFEADYLKSDLVNIFYAYIPILKLNFTDLKHTRLENCVEVQ